MLRANRPVLAFFDSIKALRIRQLAMILKAGYDPNLMINARGQNGLQFMINYFGATDAHFRLQVPINKSAYLNIAKLLLDSGLDPNALDLLADETVLFDAIRYNDKEMVALLLNYVDVSLRNKVGETALMCAARFGSKQVARLLLDHLRHLEMDGYFLRQRNRFGLTPLEIARSENLEAAKVITKHLIGYGQRSGVMLSRSVSHHQLVGPRRPLVATRPRLAATAAAVAQHRRELLAADVDYISPSDYDSDELLPTAPVIVNPGPLARRPTLTQLEPALATAAAGLRPAATNYNYQAYYDPKAAEFSQYLLDQQAEQQQQQQQQQLDSQAATGSGMRSGHAHLGGRTVLSDDDNNEDDYCGQYGGYRGGAPRPAGALVRSRSCMLGPGSSLGGGAAGANGTRSSSKSGAKKHEGSSKLASGWQDQSANDAQ